MHITEQSIIDKINNLEDSKVKLICVSHYETYVHKWAKPEILHKLDQEINQIINYEK